MQKRAGIPARQRKEKKTLKRRSENKKSKEFRKIKSIES
jgi:hypothetical protein